MIIVDPNILLNKTEKIIFLVQRKALTLVNSELH